MKFYHGVTEVELKIDKNDMVYFHVNHSGNMGSIKKDVISNFRRLFNYGKNVSIEVRNEKGSPDYLYTADFYLV